MTKSDLRVIIGKNVARERMRHNMTIDELSELLGVTPGFLALVERGLRGTTAQTLYKLSDIFGVSIDSLFLSDREDTPEREGKATGKRNRVSSTISLFTETELDFLLSIIKGIKKMNSVSQA